MKKVFKSALVLAVAALALGTTSCSKKGCTNEAATNYDSKAKKDDGSCVIESSDLTVADGESLPSEVVSGQTVTVEANASINLSEAITVRDGGKLIIEEGVTVTADGGAAQSMFVAVEMGGKIDAETAYKNIKLELKELKKIRKQAKKDPDYTEL